MEQGADPATNPQVRCMALRLNMDAKVNHTQENAASHKRIARLSIVSIWPDACIADTSDTVSIVCSVTMLIDNMY